uniref:Uncharacterized protein n=1 Tax=Anguilla anguilla TaxID=7936 RepID=A0A0E9WC98_ANGAN
MIEDPADDWTKIHEKQVNRKEKNMNVCSLENYSAKLEIFPPRSTTDKYLLYNISSTIYEIYLNCTFHTGMVFLHGCT